MIPNMVQKDKKRTRIVFSLTPLGAVMPDYRPGLSVLGLRLLETPPGLDLSVGSALA